MKKIGAVLLVFAGVWVFLQAQNRPANIFERPEQFERSRDFDVSHYRIVCRLDDAAKTMKAEASVTLIVLKDGLREISLDADQFKVENVSGPGGAPLPFRMGGGRLTLTPAEPLKYGETATVIVHYILQDPKEGMKFLPETPDAPAQINTYNWPEDAHQWLPCLDSPNDKASSEFLITVRGDWKALSNGRLVGTTEDKSAGTRTFHWLQDKPHPTYNIMLAAGPFEVLSDQLGGLPVDYWVYPKDVADAPRSFEKTPRMIDFYNRTFDYPYPWAKYDQVCYAGFGGGMEATSATMLGHGTIHDARADQDFPSGGLVSHELAHQWWGDLVTERHWTDVWLSESFATYAEYLWTRFDLGEDEGALNLLDKKNAYLREAKTRYMRPLVFNRFNQPWDVMDSHSYPKGATILHMLRFILGDKPFFQSLSLYLHRFEFRSADTHDFMNAVKDAAGVNMDWFFKQWVFQAGHPVFEVGWTWDEAGGKARLRVAQTQDLSKGLPVYRTPVRIGIITNEGHRTETIEVAKTEEVFDFPCASRPLSIRFDEGHFLLKELKFDKPAGELLYDLGHDDAVGRLWAARELAGKIDEPGVAAALRETARKDAFWAVRRGALEAVLPVLAPDRAAFLKERALDPSSKVRAAAIWALGEDKDRRLVSFFSDRFAKDSSYVVQGECLTALGKCGDPKAGPFLRRAAAMPSPRGLLKRSAEAALKALGLATGS